MSDNKTNRPEENQSINIELPEEQADGTYANFVVITHSHAEFIMDFTRVVPGVNRAKIQSRIIMAPQNAKALLQALDKNISGYEQQYGDIKIPRDAGDLGPFGFNPPEDVLPN